MISITVAAGGGGGEEASKPPTTSDTQTEDNTDTQLDEGRKPVEPESPSGVGPGTHHVGDDMAPGTYRTGGPSDTDLPSCYWARLKDASGEFESIIANGNPEGPTTVTVNAGEYFETSGCENWVKLG